MAETPRASVRRPRVVVGFDGSHDALKAVEWAAGFCRALDAELSLIAAWDSIVVLGAPVSLTGYNPQQALTDKTDLALEAAGLGSDRVHALIARGDAAQMLVDASQDADLLVVGRRGFGGFAHLVVGSVSDYCLSHAACTVCVVPLADKS